MTAVAGIGCADPHREIGAWNPEGMISAGIHSHVSARHHVAVDARGTFGSLGVVMMGWLIISCRIMTADAEGIARKMKFTTVGIVTVGAGHSLGVHLALQE